jgi:hypothetical protein
MPEAPHLRSIEVDLAANTLRLALADGDAADITSETLPATIDVGVGGRLHGVELAEGYVDVMPPEAGAEHLTRSAIATVTVERERGSGMLATVIVPRRGAGYEITWPSGNQ